MKTKQIQAFYNTVANAYAENLFEELTSKSLDRLLLERFAKIHQQKKIILDLGCGPGQTTYFLAKQGLKNIIGIDLSAQMIEQAKKLSPTLNFQIGNILELNFNDASVDGIVAFYAIVHFLVDDLKQAFLEIFRILKKQSEFLF